MKGHTFAEDAPPPPPLPHPRELTRQESTFYRVGRKILKREKDVYGKR
jgi:hypothetical protein